MRHSRIAVTGATGSLGKVICELLAERLHEVIPIGRTPLGERFRQVDLLDPDKVAAAISDVDCIVHAAGKTGAHDVGDTNVQMARAIGAASTGDQLVINLSSVAVYGRVSEHVVDESVSPQPVSDYGRSKLRSEAELDRSQAQICHLRIGNVFDGEHRTPLPTSQRARFIRANEATNLVFRHDVADLCAHLVEWWSDGESVPTLVNVVRPGVGDVPLHRLIGPTSARGMLHRRVPARLPHLLRTLRRLPSLPNRAFTSSALAATGFEYRPVTEVAPDSWFELTNRNPA